MFACANGGSILAAKILKLSHWGLISGVLIDMVGLRGGGSRVVCIQGSSGGGALHSLAQVGVGVWGQKPKTELLQLSFRYAYRNGGRGE